MSFAIKRTTLTPSITINVAADLTGITLTAIRWRLRTGAPATATAGTPGNLSLVSAAATGSVIQYDWAAGDTDIAGLYEGEIEGTIGGVATRIPGAGYFRFAITPELA